MTLEEDMTGIHKEDLIETLAIVLIEIHKDGLKETIKIVIIETRQEALREKPEVIMLKENFPPRMTNSRVNNLHSTRIQTFELQNK